MTTNSPPSADRCREHSLAERAPFPDSNAVNQHLRRDVGPSRRDNPFATCWTRPGALPFRFSDDQSVDRLVRQLAVQHWQGAIIGPHGSGKSTLLESLKPALAAADQHVHAFTLHNGQRHLPRDSAEPATNLRNESQRLIIVDGYEQLAWLERVRLVRRCRRRKIGLVVTAHWPTRVPTLIRLEPNCALITKLVADLCAQVSICTLPPEEIAASHACHGSNVREIFFDLYDRHERRRQRPRTTAACAT